MINFVNYQELIRDVKEFSKQLPEFDLIVGIARSGLLPALLLSLDRNVGLGLFDTELRIIKAGRKKELSQNSILVIDDSVNTGGTLEKVKKVLSAKYACLYTVLPAKTDYYYKVIELPRIFEWNLFHHALNLEMAFDLDGIFCKDPEKENYDEFISTTKTLIIPTYGIGAIITGRTENYREKTEKWLNENGIKYKELLMRKDKNQDIATFKAEQLRNSEYKLFIESEPKQAIKISQLSGKQVISL